MRYCVLTVLLAGSALAQSGSITTYTTDINGEVHAAVTTTTAAPGETSRTELSQSLNGRQVPLEQTDERVLRQDSSGKVTEKIVRRYDRTGQLISTERTLTEEQKLPGGASKTTATTSQTDINGDKHQTQRVVSNTQVSGSTMTTDTSIERPSIDGSFAPAEKRTTVTVGTDSNKTVTETVYRPGPNGFAPAVQTVTADEKSGDTVVERTREYERGATGDLQLHSRSVGTTTKQANGTEVTELNLYSPSVPGTVQQAGSPEQIKEQQIITRQKAPDGSTVETISVRRPTLSDPNRLGTPQQISKTVCTGKCD